MSLNLLINNQIRPPIGILKLIIHWIFPYSEVSPPGQNLGSALARGHTIDQPWVQISESCLGCVKKSYIHTLNNHVVWVCSMLNLADCVLSPSFRAEPKCHPQEDKLAFEGRNESFPEYDHVRPDPLLPNEDYRVSCCVNDPRPYVEGHHITGPCASRLERQNSLTERELLHEDILERAANRRSSRRRNSSLVNVLSTTPGENRVVVRRLHSQRLSYNPPELPPDWSVGNNEEDRVRPPTRIVEEFND